MPKLTGDTSCAMNELSIDDQAAPDPVSDKDNDHGAPIHALAEPLL
jgi:hypothetical protein